MHRILLVALALADLASAQGFRTSQSFPLSGRSVVADFDRDGYPDVRTFSGTSSVLLSGSPGGLVVNPAQSLPGVSSPREVAVGDLNGDGALDLALYLGSGPAISGLISSGTGFVVRQTSVSSPQGFAGLLDLNGDPFLDAAWLEFGNGLHRIVYGMGTVRGVSARPVGCWP